MSRRPIRLVLGLLLGAAAVGVALPLLLRRSGDAGGPGVLVRVVDPAGRPVREAEVQARYAPGWHRAASDGTVRLASVPLRAGEDATPAAIADAVDARAPFFGARGREPTGRLDPASGHVEVTVVLEAHGVVRLLLAQNRYTDVRAWVEPDPVLARVEALDGKDVARSADPTAWRVYPGLAALHVRLRGDGGMAWRRIRIAPPSPGFLREVSLVPERAQPIAGMVVLPEGPDAPPATGRVEVAEMQDDGTSVAMDPVVVAEDGGFTVPYAGAGRYELRPVLALYDGAATEYASGGAFVEVRGARPLPRLEATFPGLAADDVQRLGIRAEGRGADAESLDGQRHAATLRLADRVLVAFRPGTVGGRVDVRLGGTDASPPRAGSWSGTLPPGGPGRAEVTTTEVPWGTVVVRTVAGGLPAGGARVDLGPGRARSVLPGLSPEARFPHVEAGDVLAEVTWAGDAATCLLAGTVTPGGSTVLEARAERGGFLELLGAGPGLATDDEDRTLSFGPRDSPYAGVSHVLTARRQRASARWRVAERLVAGTYRFEVAKPSTGARQVVDVVVPPDATATVPVEVP